MAPRPRFEKLEDEKQERILLAAAEEFGSKGFEGASLNKIIEKAEISKGAAYYYFDDKEDLYTTALEYGVEKLAKWLADFALDDLDADNFWDRLREFGITSTRHLKKHPWMTQLFKTFYAYADSHAASPPVRALWQAARGWTQRFIERGQDVGRVRTDMPMDLLIEALFGLGQATDHWMLRHVDDLDDEGIERTADIYVDMFRRLVDPELELP